MITSIIFQGLKRPVFLLLIPILLLFSACVKCGEDVLLGEFELMPESKAYWDSFSGDETLTFVDGEGGEILLQRTQKEEQMNWTTFFYLCMKNNDSAEEYYIGELLYYQYTGLLDGDTLLLRCWFEVQHVPQHRQLLLFDHAVFSFQVNRQTSIDETYIQIVSSSRGNNISSNNLPYFRESTFTRQKEINDQIFADIWYHEELNQTSIFVQKGKGVVGFGDSTGTVWTLKQP